VYHFRFTGVPVVDWVPVSREAFETILTQEIAALEPQTKRLYQQYAVRPFHQRCVRGKDYGTEHVYVVARNGNRLVYYDDVEEEFGVGIPDADGVLRNWGNYDGPLVRALLVLGEDSPAF